MGGGFESRCVARVYGADGAVHGILHFSNKNVRAFGIPQCNET